MYGKIPVCIGKTTAGGCFASITGFNNGAVEACDTTTKSLGAAGVLGSTDGDKLFIGINLTVDGGASDFSCGGRRGIQRRFSTTVTDIEGCGSRPTILF